MAQNLYDVLGVGKTDSHDIIKKAYRKLARETHPDRNKDNPKAEERFKAVSSAWDVLGDKEQRKLYDQFGDAATKPGFDANRARAYHAAQGGRGRNVDFGGFGGGQAVDLGDLLGGMFGMGGARGQRVPNGFGQGPGGFSSGFGPSPGPDLQAAIAVEFETAVLGGERTLTLSDGQNLTVRIPEGVRHGETLRLRGKGGRGQGGGRNGDLRITISVTAHPVYTRDDFDLSQTVDITAVQAIRGDKLTVSTLTGDVKLTLQPGAQSGQKLRLTGKGVKRRERTGDMYVELRVVLPQTVPDEVLDALQAAYDAETP